MFNKVFLSLCLWICRQWSFTCIVSISSFQLNMWYLSVFYMVSLSASLFFLPMHTFTTCYLVCLKHTWLGWGLFCQLSICLSSGERTGQCVQIFLTCWATFPVMVIANIWKLKQQRSINAQVPFYYHTPMLTYIFNKRPNSRGRIPKEYCPTFQGQEGSI